MKKRTGNHRTPMSHKSEESAPPPNLPAPSPEQIRKRAQEIFESRGCTPGSELEDWLQAEIELRSAIARPGDSVK